MLLTAVQDFGFGWGDAADVVVVERPMQSASLSMLACYGWMLVKPSLLVRQTADAGTATIKSMRS